MIEGLSAALSGLRAYVDRTRTTANNLANLRTPGFKTTRAVQTAAEGGRGARIVALQSLQSQGSLMTTGGALDMAISGSGYFRVKTSDGGFAYTRSGAFRMDASGRLVDPRGNAAQGYRITTAADGSTTQSGAASDIELSGATNSPRQSSGFRMGLNLDARAPAGTAFSTTFNVYNSQGEETPLTYTFTKQAGGNSWNYQASGPAGTTVSGPGSAGTLTFDAQGKLTAPATDQALTISGFPSGAADLALNWDIADETTSAPHGDITGYASQSATNSITQDGSGAGILQGFAIDENGVVSGVFSNGAAEPMYQLQMANFNSPEGLSQLGEGLLGETAQSGQPVLGVAGAGGFGSIQGGALEMSNVDIAAQMVELIQNKVGFSAQIKSIQAADEMMGSILDIKA